ncbi:MAG: FadR family transcriptional regulator, partial [Candidatus Cloacimonetes bacterium]|nr:FadR family transcriptional regulator [Candidatus Cloacimonadota bacterium]
MLKFEKVEKSTTLEIIIKQIKDQIRSGEIQHGDKLPSERELSEIMEVSRTSVREAIKALTFSGYLDVIQGKGAFVSESALKYDEIFPP